MQLFDPGNSLWGRTGVRNRELPLVDYHNHPGYSGRTVSEIERVSAVKLFEPVLEAKQNLILENLDIFNSRRRSSRVKAAAQLSDIGAVGLEVPRKQIDQILSNTREAYSYVRTVIGSKRRSRLKFRDTQVVVHNDVDPAPEYQEIEAIVRRTIAESGAIEISEAYFQGCRAVLTRTVFRVNVPGQPFYTSLSKGDGRGMPKTAGMHIDANARPVINGVIYLSDVGPEQGPFKVVSGSNRWRFDANDRAIRKAMDDRGIREDAEAFLMALPESLRRKANFGHDIIDDTEQSKTLLCLERPFLSEKFNVVLFDPEAVHRGGLVTQGERVAIIFGLRMVRP
jgi:hypothetical protein